MRFLLLALLVVCVIAESPKRRIAIVGAGMSGATFGAFLKQILQSHGSSAASSEVELHYFEARERYGGRVYHQDLAEGGAIEVGGSIFLNQNRYVFEFAKQVGLQVIPASGGGVRLGIWDQDRKTFPFIQSHWRLITAAVGLWHYGLFDIFKVKGETDVLLAKWNQIYTIQDQGESFAKVQELLERVGLYNYTQAKFLDMCPDSLRNSLLVSELGGGLTYNNYNQRLTKMHAMSVFLALSTMLSGAKLMKVQGGNMQVIKELIARTNGKVLLNTVVSSIAASESGGYRLTYRTAGQPEAFADFDIVVLATPLELSPIVIHPNTGVKQASIPKREFQSTHCTLVRGVPNAGYWEAEDLPDVILMAETKDRSPFSSFATWRKFPDNSRLIKIFSPEPIDDATLDKLFINRSSVFREPWQAYPRLNPPEIFPETILAPNMYYISAIENAGSAMEMVAMWSRNVALLVAKSLGVKLPAAAPQREL